MKKTNLIDIATGRHRPGVVYARVSSKDPEKEGFSILAQEDLLRSYAGAYPIEVLREFLDVETASRLAALGLGR